YLAVDGDRRADRRHQYCIPRLHPRVIGRVAAKQQVVEVEGADLLAVPYVSDVAQRADLLDAAARIQRVRYRREAAHEIGPGTLDVAEHVNLHRAQLAERHARRHADHLLADDAVDRLAHRIEREPGYVDGPDLGEVDHAVAGDRQEEFVVAVPEELNVDGIAGPDDVVDGHRQIIGSDRLTGPLEEVVSERLERSGAHRPQREARNDDLELPKRGLRADAGVRLLCVQPAEGDRRHAGEEQLAGRIELVGVTFAQPALEILELLNVGARKARTRVFPLLDFD